MKKLLLIALILCQTAHLYSQSEITLTIDEARLLHKQQLRLVFADSANVILTNQYNTCKEQKSILINALDNRKKDIETLEAYNLKFQNEYSNLQKENKKLKISNRLLKMGFVGGITIGAAVAFGVLILK